MVVWIFSFKSSTSVGHSMFKPDYGQLKSDFILNICRFSGEGGFEGPTPRHICKLINQFLQ